MTGEKEIGLRIKEIREKSRLNQTHLASYLEVDQSYISKCEKGEREFSVDLLEKISNLFGYSLSELISDDFIEKPLNIAFRSKEIHYEDLSTISEINKIALNLKEMKKIIQEM